MPAFSLNLIESLHTAGPRIELWDTECVGLGIRVTALGRKTWTYRYTYMGIGYRRPIGEWPAIPLEKARELAYKMRIRVLSGDPPHLEPVPELQAFTFKQLADRFLDRHVLPKLAKTTIKSYTWVVRSILVPAFGPMLVSEIEPRHVEEFHASLVGMERKANLAVAVLSKMMTLAERWGYRGKGTNPCDTLDRYPEKARERYLTADEIQILWDELDKLDHDGENIYLTAAIRFALLTGCRKGEITNLEWNDVDLDGRTFRIRKHKTVGILGSVVKHLSEPAWRLLSGLPRKSGSKLVFPGKRPGCKVHIDDGWDRIRAAAKLQDVHFHDLRHTFGTMAGAANISLHIIAGAMNQVDTGSTRRYAHQVPESIQQAVDAVGAAVERAVKKAQ